MKTITKIIQAVNEAEIRGWNSALEKVKGRAYTLDGFANINYDILVKLIEELKKEV